MQNDETLNSSIPFRKLTQLFGENCRISTNHFTKQHAIERKLFRSFENTSSLNSNLNSDTNNQLVATEQIIFCTQVLMKKSSPTSISNLSALTLSLDKSSSHTSKLFASLLSSHSLKKYIACLTMANFLNGEYEDKFKLYFIRSRGFEQFSIKRVYDLEHLVKVHVISDVNDTSQELINLVFESSYSNAKVNRVKDRKTSSFGYLIETFACVTNQDHNQLLQSLKEASLQSKIQSKNPIDFINVDESILDSYAVKMANQYLNDQNLRRNLNPHQIKFFKVLSKRSQSDWTHTSRENFEPHTVQIPEMNGDEEELLMRYIHEANIGYDNLDKLEDYLSKKQFEFESQNIEELQMCEEPTRHIVKNINQCMLKMKQMSAWMCDHKPQLNSMQNSIQQIESTKQQLGICETNHRKIYDTLTTILIDNGFYIEEETEKLLLSDVKDLLKSQKSLVNLKKVLKASRALQNALKFECVGSLKDLENMQAVRDQKQHLDTLSQSFSSSCSEFFVSIVVEYAESVLKNKFVDKEVVDDTVGKAHSELHLKLQCYVPLAETLANLDRSKFLKTGNEYLEHSTQIYENELSRYFNVIQRRIKKLSASGSLVLDLGRVNGSNDADTLSITNTSQPPYSLSLQSCKALTVEQSYTAQFVNTMKPIRKSIDTKRTFTKTSFYYIFSELINRLCHVVLAERDFCSEFFEQGGCEDDVFESDRLRESKINRSTSNLFNSENMISTLFESLGSLLQQFADTANKIDSYLCLQMAVKIEEIAEEPSNKSCSVLLKILTGFHSYLALLGNKYIQSQCDQIRKFKKTNVRRAGVIEPFRRFPRFVYNLELIFYRQKFPSNLETTTNTKSRIGFSYYTKLVAALQSLLDSCAAQNSKYSTIVQMENCHFFFKVFESSDILGLNEHVRKAEENFLVYMQSYVAFSVDYEFEQNSRNKSKTSSKPQLLTRSVLKTPVLPSSNSLPSPSASSVSNSTSTVQSNTVSTNSLLVSANSTFTQFCSQLQQVLLNGTCRPEDVQFTQGLSKKIVQQIFDDFLEKNKLTKTVGRILKRVQKHLGKNIKLIEEVWSASQTYVIQLIEDFQFNVRKCYANEKLEYLDLNIVQQMFESISPSLSHKIDNVGVRSINTKISSPTITQSSFSLSSHNY